MRREMMFIRKQRLLKERQEIMRRKEGKQRRAQEDPQDYPPANRYFIL